MTILWSTWTPQGQEKERQTKKKSTNSGFLLDSEHLEFYFSAMPMPTSSLKSRRAVVLKAEARYQDLFFESMKDCRENSSKTSSKKDSVNSNQILSPIFFWTSNKTFPRRFSGRQTSALDKKWSSFCSNSQVARSTALRTGRISR